MKIAICDDLAEQRRILKDYIRRLEKEEHLEIDICEFTDGNELVDYFNTSTTKPDIIFLDIYMHELDGINAMKSLRAKGYDGSVVFCTTSIEHAVESYKLKADGYLVKPYNYDEFIEAIWRCRRHFENSKRSLKFVSDRLEYSIPLKEIVYIETEQRYCVVHTKTESIHTYRKIGEFESDVSGEASFMKIGRCYLVNLNAVKSFDSDKLNLSNGDSIAFPTRERKRLAQAVNDFFWSVARGDANG